MYSGPSFIIVTCFFSIVELCMVHIIVIMLNRKVREERGLINDIQSTHIFLMNRNWKIKVVQNNN